MKLATENLSKIFGPRPERALQFLERGGSKAEAQERFKLAVGVYDVSLQIREGETFVLMGLSGSGKSTLLRLLNRLHEPTSGRVLVDGIDITALNHRDLLQLRREKFSGMVFQQFAILPQRTVLENVGYGLEIQRVNPAERRERSMQSIELVGLAGWEDNYPSQLSGGMQQRVGLARALAVEADILLMDEAFSALDPLIRREMQDELLEIQGRMNKTIVFVTHDLDEALKLGDRIAIMRDAQIVQVGTAEQIISEPADDYVSAFVEGVDRSEILTASNIMQRPLATAQLRQGPRTALTKLRRYGLSGLFVTNSDRELQGYLSSEELVKQAREVPSEDSRLRPEWFEKALTVRLDTPLHEVIDLSAQHSGPIAVVDERNRLRGVIVKGAILAALAGRGNGVESGPGSPAAAGEGSF
jgi:glycine betaine/proline transport system ATP-binding protein